VIQIAAPCACRTLKLLLDQQLRRPAHSRLAVTRLQEVVGASVTRPRPCLLPRGGSCARERETAEHVSWDTSAICFTYIYAYIM
jgi:hypothetical protein